MTAFSTETTAWVAGALRRAATPSLLAVLAQDYPERSVEELAQALDRAARVAAGLGEWTPNAGDYMLALARDRLDVRRARETAAERSKPRPPRSPAVPPGRRTDERLEAPHGATGRAQSLDTSSSRSGVESGSVW